MTRIVAGAAKGRRLRVPHEGTRPTSERAREALFSSLGDVAGLHVLDLFAGTGALGLEALSRGAASVALVESDRTACSVLRANIAAVGLPGARAHCVGAAAFLRRRTPGSTFDLVFLDPPYRMGRPELTTLLGALAEDALAAGGVVVVERSARDAGPQWPEQITADRQRRYGDAVLWYGHRR